jgi:hypothetical protein
VRGGAAAPVDVEFLLAIADVDRIAAGRFVSAEEVPVPPLDAVLAAAVESGCGGGEVKVCCELELDDFVATDCERSLIEFSDVFLRA